MKVSVILPTYNYAHYIEEAVESVLHQTFSDFELIIVDDGSTDDTQSVLSRIDDPRIQIVSTPNRGLCAACNEGLDRARGEFIAFLGADDRFRPDKLERQVGMMEAEPDLATVFTNFVRFDEHGFFPKDQFFFYPELATIATRETRDGGGRRVIGDPFCTLVSFNEIPAWSGVMLFRASSIRGLRFALRGLHRGLNGDLHFGALAFRRGGVGFITEPLVEVRRHSENVTRRPSDIPYAKLAALLLVEQDSLSREQRSVLNRSLGRAWIGVGAHKASEGRKREAIPLIARGLQFKGARLSALKNLALLVMPERVPN
jgi:glycosyltransferase involved in cell wall biosynthesis